MAKVTSKNIPADDEDDGDNAAPSASLINAGGGEPPQSGLPLLQAAEHRIESQLLPDVRQAYMRIVAAGMKAALSKGPNSIAASLRNSKNPVRDCALGALNLTLILQRQARGTMPLKAMVPAAVVLMLKALAFAQQAGIVKVDANVLSHAMRLLVNTLFARAGITPKMLQTAAQRVQGVMSDPGSMERIKRVAGVVKDPNASTPTPMPSAEGTA